MQTLEYATGPGLTLLPWPAPTHLPACLAACLPGCSNALEDPWVEPSESMFTRSVSPEQVGGWVGTAALLCWLERRAGSMNGWQGAPSWQQQRMGELLSLCRTALQLQLLAVALCCPSPATNPPLTAA